MSDKTGPEMLAKSIERAIEQARDLGMPMTVHILMMARIEVEQSRQVNIVGPSNETTTPNS